MQKTTVQASPDIAFVKYWGNKNAALRLPENGSVCMVLDGLYTTTTVEFDEKLTAHDITIEGEQDAEEVARAAKQLDTIRKSLGIAQFAKVVSENSFPKATGLSSSSSAFAALTIAATKAAGCELSQKELSILARQGSGSACRCVCDGFVEWVDGDTSETSFSTSLFPAEHWDIRDVVIVVDEGKKRVSTTEGHKSAQSSVFYATRQANIKQKITDVKAALAERNFTALGELIETEALEFHSILLTSQPPLIAWYPGTLEVMLAVQQWRREGLEAYFTINTGFNIHVLTLPENVAELERRLGELSLVKKLYNTRVGSGPKEVSQHLF